MINSIIQFSNITLQTTANLFPPYDIYDIRYYITCT